MENKKFEYLFESLPLLTIDIVLTAIILGTTACTIIFSKVGLLIIALLAAFTCYMLHSAIFKNAFYNKKMFKKALKNGNKIPGKIAYYKKNSLLTSLTGFNVDSEQINSMDSACYSLIIEYDEKTFETPQITTQSPQTFFSSDKCNVYILDNYVLAYDFEVANDGNFVEINEYKEEETDVQ